jgi:phospholipid/cholesterol/gamma-HCH transport system substrate-binding protein
VRRTGFRDVIDPISAEAVEHPTRNGAILVIVALLVIVGVVTNKIPILDAQSGYTIHANFAKVNDVNNRTPVRVDGFDVGMVTGVGAGADALRASQLKMQITDSGLVVHSNASAQIRWRTILGGSVYIDLNPGSSDAPKLTGAIPVSRTGDQVEFDDVLRIYNGNTAQAQRATITGLSQTFTASAAEDKSIGALSDLTTVAAGLKPYSGTDPGDLSRLVGSTARTAQALGANLGSLQNLVDGASATLGAVDHQRAALGQMLAMSPATLNSTYVTMRRIDVTLHHLNPLVTHLEPGARMVQRMSDALRPALHQTQAVLDQARPLLRSARPTFANLRAASGAGVPLLQGLLPAIGRLNSNILPWLQQRSSDTRMINYEAIGPTFSVLDKADAEFDSSGYRLHLSTLLGTASVIDEADLTAARTSMLSECQQDAKPTQVGDCGAVSNVLLGMLYGGEK